MKRFILAFLFVSCSLSIFAQKFIIDPLFSDSVKCSVAVKKDTVWADAEPYQKVMFAKGLEIESCGTAEGYYIAFEYQHKHYRVFKDNLKFSDDNPSGVVNPLDKKNIRHHSSMGHFYATFTPVILILILIGVILLVFGIALYVDSFRRIAIITIPFALLCISIIEIIGYLTLGGDVFWWCDNDRYGFFGALLRVIPFGAVVALQFYSIKMYELVLFAGEPEGSEKHISLKPAAISIALCIPVVIAYCFIVQLIIGWKGTASEIVLDVLTLGTLFSGIILSFKRNISTMGTLKGIALSVFGIIYIIGLLVAVWGVVIVLIRLIIQVLMVIAAGIAIAVMGKPRYYKGSDGHIYSDSGFENMHRVD